MQIQPPLPQAGVFPAAHELAGAIAAAVAASAQTAPTTSSRSRRVRLGSTVCPFVEERFQAEVPVHDPRFPAGRDEVGLLELA
jgi:hypothetical protein